MLFQLKVVLQGVDPPIWRTLQVPGYVTLFRLHQVLQVAMGWENRHLYLFRAGANYYGEPSGDGGLPVQRAKKVRLLEVISAQEPRLIYEYDMGDGWLHEITAEGVVEGEGAIRCNGGARACPPEDCGGPAGYAALLQALSDPRHENHAEMLEWVGSAFDPEKFDRAAANRALRRLAPHHVSRI